MKRQKGLSTLIDLLQILRGIDTEFPLQYALCMGEIARNQGISITELAEKTGITLSTVSRIVGALSGGRGRCNGLVRVRFSATENRRKELFLSPRGAALIAHLVTEIEQTPQTRQTA